MQKKNSLLLLYLIITTTVASAQQLPPAKETLKALVSVNGYFMKKYADCTQPIVVKGISRPSNIWTRGIYYEGLMALYSIFPDDAYYDYATHWADFHQWGFRNGSKTRNADDICAAQTYIDLYRLAPQSEKIRKAKSCGEMLLNTPIVNDWTWIDAIQMGMPVLAKLGTTLADKRYYDKMWQMYSCTRNKMGLFNASEGLWWRDKDFLPPYKEPNGEDCYWARGNGWVYTALVKVMNEIPVNEIHHKDYLKDFINMSKALKQCQREDGFWNVSLHDATHFGGKETTGTSLFVYGMAWGIRQGILSRSEYLPVVAKAWNALLKESVHPDGFLGYVQGTGKEPKDSQPVGYDNVPDYEDFGVGCFLLGGSEVYKL